MIQYILIAILGLGAAAYLGRLLYRSFAAESCESGCGKCGTLDIKAIHKQIEKKASH